MIRNIGKKLIVGMGMLMVLAAPVLAAETPALEAVTAVLEWAFRPVGTDAPAIHEFGVDFSQESEIAALGQRQTARGRALFRFLPATEQRLVSPLFCWEYVTPHQQKIVSDGETVWFYIPENQQAIRSESREALAEQGGNPLLFLTNIGELERVFTVRWADARQDDDGDYRLLLTPKQQTPLIRALVLTVLRQAVTSRRLLFPLKTILITNVNGDRSFIHFAAPVINGGIPPETFRFSPPEGTEVLTPEQFQSSF